MLGRAASGIGALSCRVIAPTPADVAVAYEARGVQGVLTGADRHGPDAEHPRFWRRDDGVHVDLGHVDEISRFAVVVRSSGGTLVGTTATGARIDLDLPDDGRSVALTGHVVLGCLVLRAEGRSVTGTLRDAADAYGYDDVTWASPDRPLSPSHPHPHPHEGNL